MEQSKLESFEKYCKKFKMKRTDCDLANECIVQEVGLSYGLTEAEITAVCRRV